MLLSINLLSLLELTRCSTLARHLADMIFACDKHRVSTRQEHPRNSPGAISGEKKPSFPSRRVRLGSKTLIQDNMLLLWGFGLVLLAAGMALTTVVA